MTFNSKKKPITQGCAAKAATAPLKVDIQPIVVGKPGPGVSFYFTGNVMAGYCILVQERVGSSGLLGLHYLPVEGPALSALVPWIKLVVYREVRTETGEYYAFPQVLGEDQLNPDDWQACECRVFDEPIRHWIYIDYIDGGYEHSIGTQVQDDLLDGSYFNQQLDAALAPFVIDSVDNPVVKRLRMLFGYEDYDAPWNGQMSGDR